MRQLNQFTPGNKSTQQPVKQVTQPLSLNGNEVNKPTHVLFFALYKNASLMLFEVGLL